MLTAVVGQLYSLQPSIAIANDELHQCYILWVVAGCNGVLGAVWAPDWTLLLGIHLLKV